MFLINFENINFSSFSWFLKSVPVFQRFPVSDREIKDTIRKSIKNDYSSYRVYFISCILSWDILGPKGSGTSLWRIGLWAPFGPPPPQTRRRVLRTIILTDLSFYISSHSILTVWKMLHTLPKHARSSNKIFKTRNLNHFKTK